jgi:Holliday junction resolvasome RuvABC endonuclease subunit
MSIVNVNKIVAALKRNKFPINSYTYTRVSNLLSGKRGGSDKKEIQQVRKVIQSELLSIDRQLAKLENEA